MSDRQYDNRNKGVLFKNKDRRDDKDPLYRGQINIGGQEYWLDAWLNESKAGDKYMALRVKPKQAQEHKGGSANPPARTKRDDFDSEIPF